MDFLTEALIDTGKLVPFLLVIYFLVGFLEYRYGDRMGDLIVRFGLYGPFVGSLFGCIPQCGFSVVAATLYVKRLISLGTLLAVFISTSDEAVPVLLSMPDKAPMVGSLIVLKLVIAIVAGTAIDLVLRFRKPVPKPIESHPAESPEDEHHQHGCCEHGVTCHRSDRKLLLIHPLQHTLKITAYLLALSILLNFALARIGEERIGSILMTGSIFQPVLASLIGLIPNCFASVLLANLFAKGVISFGAMVGGLCAGAGLGVLVLVKENKSWKNTLLIIVLLLAVSIGSGILMILFEGVHP
jgi:hypothetical protein